jgi:hypothetical protein
MSERLDAERQRLEKRLRAVDGDDKVAASEREVLRRAIAGIDDAARLIEVAPLQRPPALRRTA